MLTLFEASALTSARWLPSGKRLGVILNEHTLSAAQTRVHVDALGRLFDFIHLDQLTDRLARAGKRPFCLLTFDDGKRSNFTETAPELRRLGVPAVFYITTGFITSGTPLWFDRYNALRAALGSAPPGLHPDVIKLLPIAMLEERLGRACRTHGVSCDMASDDIRPMSWDDVRTLAAQGFAIGAHGIRHAVLPEETKAYAQEVIRKTIADVTNELGSPCTTFAFPNGNYTACLAQWALQCGVRTVMTTDPTWATARSLPWRLPRIQLFARARGAEIALKIALAATGCVLRNPDGTGWLYRRLARLDRLWGAREEHLARGAAGYGRSMDPDAEPRSDVWS